MWRKNRVQSSQPGCFGVDLNRNFDVAWGTRGSSDNPCSDSYHGVAPESEPEIKALKAATDDAYKFSRPVAYVGLHTYSQMLASLGFEIVGLHGLN